MIFVVAILACFGLTVIIAPILIKILKRVKVGQPILSYVEQHEGKQGTPTMGGLIFVLPTVIIAMALGAYKSKVATLIILTIVAYMIVGFLDDFIKVYYKSNEGLKPYQKILSQTFIAIAITLASYFSPYVGTQLYLPIIKTYVDFGWFYIPFTVLVYIGTSNAVNLTDGLDGLATSTTLVYFIVLGLIVWGLIDKSVNDGNLLMQVNLQYSLVVIASLVGGLMAFLIFNSSKASVFMGDTGSLALGGAVASIAVNTKTTLLILVVGITYVWSALSVIIQVIVYKLKKKRVFLMAPFHHHLELKGMSECKISVIYAVITLLAGLVSVAII